MDLITQENNNMTNKIVYYEQMINDTLLKYRDTTDSLRDKIFVLENTIVKKDNVIINLNNKLSKAHDQEDYLGGVERETYVYILFYVDNRPWHVNCIDT